MAPRVQAVLHFVVIGMAELFPLYASSPTGLRLREHEVGLALAPLAVSLFTWPFVYVVLEKRYGARATLRLGWCAFLVVNLILPQLHVLREAPALLWPCLVAVGLVRGVGGNSSFPSISLLLNSLLTENLGAHRAACMGSRAAEAPAQGRAHTARTVHPQGQPTHASTQAPTSHGATARPMHNATTAHTFAWYRCDERLRPLGRVTLARHLASPLRLALLSRHRAGRVAARGAPLLSALRPMPPRALAHHFFTAACHAVDWRRTTRWERGVSVGVALRMGARVYYTNTALCNY